MPDMHFFFENTTCQKAVNEVKSVKYDPKTLKFKLENLYGLGGRYKVQARPSSLYYVDAGPSELIGNWF